MLAVIPEEDAVTLSRHFSVKILEKTVQEQNQPMPLLTRCAETRETHGQMYLHEVPTS